MSVYACLKYINIFKYWNAYFVNIFDFRADIIFWNNIYRDYMRGMFMDSQT